MSKQYRAQEIRRRPDNFLFSRQPLPSAPLLIAFVLCFCSSVSFGQYISNNGRFSVDQIEGCAPFTVTITATNLTSGNACTSGTPCDITYEPSSGELNNVFTYTYMTPGVYDLSVLYQNTGADHIMITVLPNIPPAFEAFTCSGNRVSIDVTDKNYDQYVIDFGDGSATVTIPASANQVAAHAYGASTTYNISIHGKKNNAADNCNAMVKSFLSRLTLPPPTINTLTALDANTLKIDFSAAANIDLHLEIAVNNSTTFQLLRSLYAVSTDTIRNLTLDQNYYCFRLSSYDPCTGGNTYSNSLCSQDFAVQAVSGADQLSWVTATAGITNYSLDRNSAALTTTTGLSYTDGAVVCQTNYCYQVTSNYANGSQSISQTKCVTAISTKVPTAIDNTSAVVSDAGVELTWTQDPAFVPVEYFILKNQNAGSFQSIGSATTQKYDDPTYATSGGYCYLIDYTDQCKNNSAQGLPICPLRLVATLEKSNAVTLTWNPYQGWLNGVKDYEVKKFDQNGNLLATYIVGTATSFADTVTDLTHQVVSYEIIAQANDPGLTDAVSNAIVVVKSTNLYCPTAFTPNNDGKNDTFTVKGFFLTHLELNIFNRWGNLIFSSDNNKPWDGTFNGRLMPNDTYVWTAKGSDLAGQSFSRSGTVVLLTPAR
jgi:gliding motility-associated-like protein